VMTYHAGIAPGLESLGLYAREPFVSCNGCGKRHPAYNRHGEFYSWVIKAKAPPKWKMRQQVYGPDCNQYVINSHYCPECVAKGRCS
jgi:hypothetical protein